MSRPLATALTGRSTLVTGAAGFIGTHLCRQLSAAGARVHGVSRHARHDPSGRVHWHVADMRDTSAVRRLVEEIRPDIVFHLAGLAAGARELTMVRPTFEHNVLTTINVLEAATESGCGRIVLAGSLEEPDAGDTNIVPSSPYAASKWAASAYARMFHALYSTPVVIARIFMVYGPEQPDLKKVIPMTALALLQGQSPALSSGARAIDWIYVEDAAEGLLALATTPDIEGLTIEIGTGELVTVRGVVEHIAALIPSTGVPIFGGRSDRPMEQVRAADTEATFGRIGWTATTALPDGLARTIAWCRELVHASAPSLSER